jgi:hypothetical protein
LLQRLWLLVQGMTGRFSRPRQNRVIRAIEIEDKRFLDPQSRPAIQKFLG